MPASIHFGISSELFFFLAAGPNAILPVAGLCQLSVLPVPSSAPPLPSQLPATYPTPLMGRSQEGKQQPVQSDLGKSRPPHHIVIEEKLSRQQILN